jgi:hypothetical protein
MPSDENQIHLIHEHRTILINRMFEEPTRRPGSCAQHQGDHTQRNDRLIAIPIGLASRNPMQPVVEFNSALKKAIADFFAKYNEL